MKYIIEILKKQQGSALVTVMIFLTIIFLLTSAILVIIHIQLRFMKKDANRTQAIYLAESAIYRLLTESDAEQLSLFMERATPLCVDFEDINGHAELTLRPWGLFLKVCSTGFFKGSKATIKVIVGLHRSTQLNAAVNLKRLDFPLILTGDTKITGNVIVGPRGVRSGRIKTIKYNSKELVNGEIIKSENSFPEYDLDFVLNRSLAFYRYQLQYPDGVVLSQSLIIDSTNVAILDQAGKIFVDGDLIINGFLQGYQIKACSLAVAGQVFVNSDISFGNDVILMSNGDVNISNCSFAQSIVYSQGMVSFNGQVNGDVQVFSENKIKCSGNVNLEWPSILCVQPKNYDSEDPNTVELDEGSYIVGSVLLFTDASGGPFQTHRVFIDKSAVLTGLLYTTGDVELAGCVNGTVAANMFYFYLDPTHYMDWLLDAVIDFSRLSNEFVAPCGFNNESGFRIAVWNCEKQKR